MVIQSLQSRSTHLLLLAAFVVALSFVLPSGYYFRVAALIWTFGLAAIGLNILMGDAGQVSLGHAGFMGIGAYAVALAPPLLGMSPIGAVAFGIIGSGAIAFVVGKAVLRLRGHFLSIGTLGMGTLIALVIVTEAEITGGPDGVAVPTLSMLGVDFTSPRQWYWISAIIMLCGAWLALNLQSSASGRAMRALNAGEVAAEMSGIDTARYKLRAFVLASVFASVSGSMIALMNRFVTPDQAGFLQSIELVMMVIVGGLGSVFGSLIGAAVIVILPQVLAGFHEFEPLMLGLILMAMVGFCRKGLVPAIVKLGKQRRQHGNA